MTNQQKRIEEKQKCEICFDYWKEYYGVEADVKLNVSVEDAISYAHFVADKESTKTGFIHHQAIKSRNALIESQSKEIEELKEWKRQIIEADKKWDELYNFAQGNKLFRLGRNIPTEILNTLKLVESHPDVMSWMKEISRLRSLNEAAEKVIHHQNVRPNGGNESEAWWTKLDELLDAYESLKNKQ